MTYQIKVYPANLFILVLCLRIPLISMAYLRISNLPFSTGIFGPMVSHGAVRGAFAGDQILALEGWDEHCAPDSVWGLGVFEKKRFSVMILLFNNAQGTIPPYRQTIGLESRWRTAGAYPDLFGLSCCLSTVSKHISQYPTFQFASR